MKLSVLALLCVAVHCSIAFANQVTAPSSCMSCEHRQFDFWIGEWEVRGPAGRVAGTNRISKEYGGCVLHERYDTGRGYSGSSFNIYDAGRKRWHQTWVDNTGMLLQLDGGYVDGKMVLEGETVSAGGGRTKHRITWTPNADGSVRQLWESTNASGDWTVAFDGRYTKLISPK
jgi:hypothetical protein